MNSLENIPEEEIQEAIDKITAFFIELENKDLNLKLSTYMSAVQQLNKLTYESRILHQESLLNLDTAES